MPTPPKNLSKTVAIELLKRPITTQLYIHDKITKVRSRLYRQALERVGTPDPKAVSRWNWCYSMDREMDRIRQKESVIQLVEE